MKVNIRDLGLLLLGTGVLILALLSLHFYLTQVLPGLSKPHIFTSCERLNGKYVIRINNYGSTDIDSLVVEVNGEDVCSFSDVPAGGTEVCIVDSNKEVVAYRIKAVFGGKELLISDVCREVVIRTVKPVD